MKKSTKKRTKSAVKKKPVMRHPREGATGHAKRKPIMRHSREG